MVDHEGTNGNGAGQSPEEQYARLSERERTLPSGFVVKFRKPGAGEWAAIWESVPSFIKGRPAQAAAEASADLVDETFERAMRSIVTFSRAPVFCDTAFGSGPAGCMSVRSLSKEDLADYIVGLTEAMGFDTKSAKVASDVVNS